MYDVIILQPAKFDISEAAIWYNSKQKGLGRRFLNEVRNKVIFIRENPLATEIRYDETRCAVLKVFPFMIHYIIDEENKTIVVAAVFHTSLNPEKWQGRK